ncbi:MAG: hypothetical protein KC547_22320 [Anaerolineae bacterium]|nr:hypothetical protein [Anaerolineae bacterium]MCA9907446.1 hypothetical protein [Anaerolineae bacterium]
MTTLNKPQNPELTEHDRFAQKRPWTTPELQSVGKLREFVQGNKASGSGDSEGISGMMPGV